MPYRLIVYCYRIAIVIVISIFCFACAGTSMRSMPDNGIIVVSQKGDDIFFDYPPTYTAPAASLLDGLVMVNRETTSGRKLDEDKFWMVRVRNQESRTKPRIEFPLRYGEKIAHTDEITAAKKLTPGNYEVTINLNFDVPNTPRAVSMAAKFSIDQNLRLIK